MRYGSASRLGPEHVGARVTVRRRLYEGGQTDVIGTLEAIDASAVSLRDRHGQLVVIPVGAITAARVHGQSPRRA